MKEDQIMNNRNSSSETEIRYWMKFQESWADMTHLIPDPSHSHLQRELTVTPNSIGGPRELADEMLRTRLAKEELKS